MSFSYDIKEEIAKSNNYKNKELLEAELLGFILTANVNINENYELYFLTENDYSIERLYKILYNLHVDYEPEINGKKYIAKIKVNDEIINLLRPKNEISVDEKKAIVKGTFLSAGSCTDPEKQYELEILFEDKRNAEYVKNICKSFGINLKEIEVKEKIELYLKSSDEISTFLALLGASKAVMKFEDVRLLKEVKNNVNRKVNFETANLNKIINASVDQINDIKLLQKLNKFEELPDYLKEIALIRLENPDASLKDLGLKLENPLGKSGVNHRLAKIHEIAEDLRKGI